MAHGSMSKTLVFILAAAIPVGYVIWLGHQRSAQKSAPAQVTDSEAGAAADSR